jgi:SAM-dependent methyltransferase
MFPRATVLGLDSSAAFVAEAAAAGAERCRFAVGDVTRMPLPGAPADLVYARFLLVHLPDPAATAARWVGDLRPGGTLVVEEPEAIDTADPDFRRYLELATAVVADRGGDLYVGRRLAALGPPPGARAVLNREVPLAVTAGAAARIFSLNLATWRHDPAVAGVAGPEETADLLARLHDRVGDASAGVIRWHMRQVAIRT